MQSYNPCGARPTGLGSSLFARHYSGNHSYFLFLPVLRCFSSRGWLSFEYYTFSIVGCPIRRSRDVTLVCNSPWLIAAYHVLLRLSDPRHPPCALIRFKKFLLVTSGANKISLTTHNRYSVLQLLFPNMSKNFSNQPLKTDGLMMFRIRSCRPYRHILILFSMISFAPIPPSAAPRFSGG